MLLILLYLHIIFGVIFKTILSQSYPFFLKSNCTKIGKCNYAPLALSTFSFWPLQITQLLSILTVGCIGHNGKWVHNSMVLVLAHELKISG
jgi:hypothetical protein